MSSKVAQHAPVLLALVLAACGDPSRAQSNANVLPSGCMDEAAREHIRTVALAAVDAALKSQVEHLFGNWMKDKQSQPARAQAGMQLAIAAYLRAQSDAKKWSPPPC